MPDNTVKLRLKKNARMRLRRLCVDTSTDHRQVIEAALKALECEQARYDLAALATAPPSLIEE